MSWIGKQLKSRNKIIKKFSSKVPNFFKWKDWLNLALYSTYIFITPRGLGKTHSGWDLVIDVYMETGEWTNWMRMKDTELKYVLDDYKRNRPDAWPEWAVVKGRHLIDSRNGGLIAKFVALSTVGNLASITGNGCFGIFLDEFLPRTGAPIPNSYSKLTDFIRTIERKHLATVILSANMTTLNSDILTKFDLWIDEPEVDDKERRLRFRYIEKWDNPPKVEVLSTAALWAKNDENLRKFMEEGGVLDDSTSLVIPRSRVGQLRNLEMFTCDGVDFTLSLDNNNRFIVIAGHNMKSGFVQDLTTADGYMPSKGHIRPFDIKLAVSKIAYGLETSNLIFTDFEVKDTVFRFLQALNGRIQRKRA